MSVGALAEYQFTDIEADHRIEVKTAAIGNSNPGDKTPGDKTSGDKDVKTGDSGQIMLYLILMIAALAVGAGLLIFRKQICSKK